MSYDLRDAAFEGDEPESGLGEPAAPASSGAWRASRARAQRGDPPRSRRAFHRLYREHFGLVWSMVRRFGVPSAQHEDAVQEVWLIAYRRLHTLEPDASAKAWLSSITRRVASRLRRTDHRQRRKLAALELAASRPRTVPSAALEGRDARRLLDALLAQLDDDQRDVLLLAQVHGLTGPEIAQALEIPLNTAYSRLRLARRRVDRFAAELSAERAAVLGALRRGEQPPRRAAACAWMVLAPKLGSTLGAAGTVGGAGLGLGLGGALSGTKAFVLAVGVGVVGLVVARGVVEVPERPRDEVVDAAASGEVTPAAIGAAAQPEEARSVDASRMVAVAGDPVDRPEHDAGASSSSRSRTPEPAPVVARDAASEPAAPSGEARATNPSPAPPLDVATLTAEAELLGWAQHALRAGDAAAALELLEEHERRFPSGELRDERRGARVRALCELGRGAQARAEARRLLHDRPSSPVAAGVADVCS